MKQKMMRDGSAFTRLALLDVIAVVLVFLLTALLFLARHRVYSSSHRISCVNNLKEIGVAYRIWAYDNGDLNPAEQTVAKGGWGDFLTNADQGLICWTNYVLMQNELGQSPKLVVCPTDDRRAAVDFATNFKNNTHLSYFVGVSARDIDPQSIESGDRNLGPGTEPDPDYGFSPKSGNGNDVAVPISGAVSWSLKMHSSGRRVGAGNILIADGSAQQASSASLTRNWLRNATPTTNWPAGHTPLVPSIRLVFP